MILKILLILSVLLQVVALAIALRLTRRTKYNLSWILFSVALMLMTLMWLWELNVVGDFGLVLPPDILVWIGVVTSLCIAVGMFYVQKIFKYIEKLNHQRALTEKRILNTILRTEEKERLRFSKELHDGLGPLLSSAKMSLSVLRRDAEEGNSATDLITDSSARHEVLENTSYVIEEAIRSLREISNNLSPHILNDFGLARGVANFIDKIPSPTMKIALCTNLRTERFAPDVEVIVYRIVCELINNSLKHSGGTRIDLALDYDADTGRLTLDYRDDGKGFNPAAMIDVGMGLSNISSRISSLKGVCEITSSPGRGMRAQIEVSV